MRQPDKFAREVASGKGAVLVCFVSGRRKRCDRLKLTQVDGVDVRRWEQPREWKRVVSGMGSGWDGLREETEGSKGVEGEDALSRRLH